MSDSPLASAESNSGSDGQARPSVAVSYEHTTGLAALLERLEISVSADSEKVTRTSFRCRLTIAASLRGSSSRWLQSR